MILYSNNLLNLKPFKNKGLKLYTTGSIEDCKYESPLIIAINVNFESIQILEEKLPYKSLFVDNKSALIDEFKSNWIDVWETIVIDSEGNYNNSSQITISDEIVKNVV
jgi:hypothetical protein